MYVCVCNMCVGGGGGRNRDNRLQNLDADAVQDMIRYLTCGYVCVMCVWKGEGMRKIVTIGC